MSTIEMQPIIRAVSAGEAELVLQLVKKSDKLLSVRGGWQQMTPLFHSWNANDEDIVAILVNHGARLDIFEAAALGHTETLQALIDEDGERVHATRDHYDCTPLHCCRYRIESASLLIAAGADVDRTTYRCWTPLHGRAEHGDVAMVRLLLANGADVHGASHMGTPLHCAVGGFKYEPAPGWEKVARLLLDAGAEVDADFEGRLPGWTPLHHATGRNHRAAVSLLLSHGADPNARDHRGLTPLAVAAQQEDHTIATLLREAGAER